MSDSRADDCIREHEQLASSRGVWDQHYREVAERVRPNQNFFQQIQRPQGDKRNEKIFDDTAPLALSKFAAAVISMSFPATQRYHTLTTQDPELAKNSNVKKYLEAVTDILFRVRYSARANFQSQSGETVLDIGAFGTGILFIDDDVATRTIRYKSEPLAQSYIAENAHGVIDTRHRKYELTAHQLMGLNKTNGWTIPEKARTAWEKGDKNAKFMILHAVRPNMDRKASRADYRGMAYGSCYICLDDRSIMSEGGFRVFPFAIPRFETSPNEVYGRSPAMKVLPTIKTLNEMKKTILRAGQKALDPPIMTADDGSLQPFSVRPNAINPGYLDSNGQPLAAVLKNEARIDIGLELMNAEREIINDAFFVTLFRILVEEPAITATEAMLRAQEKGQLLAPTMGRIQSELLGPTITREIDILGHAGVLPPMPDELIEAGGMVKVDYQGPLNQAQRASIGSGILNTINGITPLAQLEPRVMKRFKIEDMAIELADINGVPARLINTDEEMEQIDAASQQADMAAQLLAAAPVAAGAAKDFAQAGATAAAATQQAPDIIPA